MALHEVAPAQLEAQAELRGEESALALQGDHGFEVARVNLRKKLGQWKLTGIIAQ